MNATGSEFWTYFMAYIRANNNRNNIHFVLMGTSV